MKVLQINCVYKTGSTGKIVYDLHRELQARGIDNVQKNGVSWVAYFGYYSNVGKGDRGKE